MISREGHRFQVRGHLSFPSIFLPNSDSFGHSSPLIIRFKSQVRRYFDLGYAG
jgi:hypothetical protein